MKHALFVVFLVVLVALSITQAQVPPEQEPWVDLRADTITYGFTAPDSIHVNVHFTILNHTPMDTFYLSDMGIFLDGILHESSGLEIDVMGDCWGLDEPECEGDCTEEINGKSVSGQCIFWKDPKDTVFAACVCSAGIRWPFIMAYAGQDVISFELDMGGLLLERDEANNHFSVAISPVAVKPSTWGRIKKLETE